MENDIIWFILSLVMLFCCVVIGLQEQKFRKDIFTRQISPQNNILFIKLKKQYLSTTSDDDIKDLITYLFKYLEERKNKK